MKKYLNVDIWVVFSALVLIYAMALTIEYKFIFNEDFFVNALGIRDNTEKLRVFFEC
jgi:hypothetical protein